VVAPRQAHRYAAQIMALMQREGHEHRLPEGRVLAPAELSDEDALTAEGGKPDIAGALADAALPVLYPFQRCHHHLPVAFPHMRTRTDDPPRPGQRDVPDLVETE